MERRKLGKTDLELPVISYGASSLGQEFRRISIDEALQSCRVAIDLGMNFIDTSPFYGRGMSEVMLGQVLRDVPRDSYTLGTKLGRYDLQHFDFLVPLGEWGVSEQACAKRAGIHDSDTLFL